MGFEREALIAWANQHSFRIALEVPGEAPTELPNLTTSVRAGGIHYAVGGNNIEDSLGEATFRLDLPDLVDREFLHQVLLAREDLGSTGVGEGFAVPHVRAPLVLHIDQPHVGICFLERPLDWGSIDRQDVDTLFVLLSPGIRAHLHLLSRISFSLRDEKLRALLSARADKDEILTRLEELDELVVS
jgi:nitrogen PTS system EIIA component